MFFRKKEKKTEIGSPVEGTLMTLNEVNDGVFSTGMMGSGFAVNLNWTPCQGHNVFF